MTTATTATNLPTTITYHCSACGVEYPDGNNLCHPTAVVDSIVTLADVAPRFTFSTLHGAHGAWEAGAEYLVDAEYIVHYVRRPMRVEAFVGYGLFDGVGKAILRVSHDGAMSQWRVRSPAYTGAIRVADHLPPGYLNLNLPDEEHGWTWGDDIDVPSDEPVRWTVGGREISEGAMHAALAAYAAIQHGTAPDLAREIVARAAAHISATEVAPGIWAHHDDATDCWYTVTSSELAELCDYLDSGDEQISRSAYSHWCAGTTAAEMPSGWSPADGISSTVEGASVVVVTHHDGIEYAAQGADLSSALGAVAAVARAGAASARKSLPVCQCGGSASVASGAAPSATPCWSAATTARSSTCPSSTARATRPPAIAACGPTTGLAASGSRASVRASCSRPTASGARRSAVGGRRSAVGGRCSVVGGAL